MKYSLNELGLIDAPPDSAFDNMTKLAASLFQTSVSLVSIVDFENNRQFFKSQQGLAEPWAAKRQTPLTHSFCQHVVNDNTTLVVNNALRHPKVKDNLAIPDLGVMAYIGAPIYDPEKQPIGAFCVIDGKPREWTHEDIERLESLSKCVTDAIKLKAAYLDSEALRMEQAEFTYAISHDLKSPVNTLQLLTSELSLLKMPEDADEHGIYIDKSLQTINRMGTLIDDILKYTCVCACEDNIIEEVSLNFTIHDIVEDLAGELAECGGSISIGDLPTLQANPMHLRMLFLNIINNAIKYRHDDIQPEILITAERINNDQYHRIIVSDNGIGIAFENRERIFKVFSRLHTAAEYPGTGLGLALCQRIASRYSGYIEVESIEGTGTQFSVMFPGNPK